MKQSAPALSQAWTVNPVSIKPEELQVGVATTWAAPVSRKAPGMRVESADWHSGLYGDGDETRVVRVTHQSVQKNAMKYSRSPELRAFLARTMRWHGNPYPVVKGKSFIMVLVPVSALTRTGYSGFRCSAAPLS